LGFFIDFRIEVSERVFSQSIILEVLGYFVVDKLTDLGFVAVLEFELVDEHALELFSLLNVH
jgi:hypothetical protein